MGRLNAFIALPILSQSPTNGLRGTGFSTLCEISSPCSARVTIIVSASSKKVKPLFQEAEGKEGLMTGDEGNRVLDEINLPVSRKKLSRITIRASLPCPWTRPVFYVIFYDGFFTSNHENGLEFL